MTAGNSISSDRVLVVGSDGRIGSALFDSFLESGQFVFGTTRRKIVNTQNEDIFFLDLASEAIDFSALPLAQVVFLVAYITNMAECEAYPSSHDVNTKRVSEIGTFYLSRGSFVVFLSTNAVFGGDKLLPNELDEPDPSTVYGQQKHCVESVLLGAAKNFGGRLAIVRLTKVLTPDLPLLKEWSNAIYNHNTINAFVDLRISPISLRYVVNNLKIIGQKKIPGIYHLSGKNDSNYFDIASRIAEICGGVPSQVLCKKLPEDIFYAPLNSSLGMLKTKEIFGIEPQGFESVSEDVFERLKR